MIALKLLPIAQLLLILFTDLAICYPSSFYNSKRFNHRPTYDPYDYYARTQRYPYTYYPSYTQLYPEEYYYNQDSYPLYYLSPRPAKYDYLPYYYQDVPVARNIKYNNNYNYADLSMEEQEKLLQEIEREQRERAQPIGHEIRYENDYNSDDDGSIDETNAAFLNNLMMQQMYHDSVNKDKSSSSSSSLNYYDQYPYADYSADESDAVNYPKWDDVPYDRPVNVDVDENVKELKELPKKQKQRKNRQRKQRKQQQNNKDISNENPSKRSEDDAVVYTDRKPVVKDFIPTEISADTSRREVRGQKEEVLMRPATPVRNPFSSSVLDMLSQQQQKERKRSPSVYDTIRHMLEMEKKYEENQPEPKSELRPSMKKRIVSSEDSLTKQLSVLKKAQ